MVKFCQFISSLKHLNHPLKLLLLQKGGNLFKNLIPDTHRTFEMKSISLHPNKGADMPLDALQAFKKEFKKPAKVE